MADERTPTEIAMGVEQERELKKSGFVSAKRFQGFKPSTSSDKTLELGDNRYEKWLNTQRKTIIKDSPRGVAAAKLSGESAGQLGSGGDGALTLGDIKTGWESLTGQDKSDLHKAAEKQYEKERKARWKAERAKHKEAEKKKLNELEKEDKITSDKFKWWHRNSNITFKEAFADLTGGFFGLGKVKTDWVDFTETNDDNWWGGLDDPDLEDDSSY